MSADAHKRAAGEAAAAMVEPNMTVGLGTGSTAAWFVRALGERVRYGLRLRGVPTSEATAELARELNIPLVDLDEAGEIDLTVDGADEIGPGLALIKGGGGALLREKLVWQASKRCVVISDSTKRVSRLGAFPLPVEVVRFGHATTARRIASALGGADYVARPQLRMREGAPFVTDAGALIYDLPCRSIADPQALAAALKAITGVVEHGLFLGLAHEAIIASDEGLAREAVHIGRR
ncbi:MAG TPA: ribose-5-phosphate isomerase RpiA [Caulobacteraceae bacterium]|jgi:ribose 5-phosphate isomerase A